MTPAGLEGDDRSLGLGWVTAALAALVVVLFKDLVLGGRVLFERDIHLFWFGQVEVFRRCIAAGSWPLWDPYLSFGQPFLANPSTQVLYPWTWLTLVLAPPIAYTVYVVSHTLLSGMGAFVLARRLGRSRGGSLLAACAWIGSGPFLSLASLWHHLGGAAWMPWVLLAADWALAAPSWFRALVWGAALAGQALAGSADMCLMTGIVVTALVLSRLRWSTLSSPENGRLGAACAVALGYAAALCAGQWMPTLDYARSSQRPALEEAMRTHWSIHPLSLAQMLLPVFPHRLPLNVAAQSVLEESKQPLLGSLYLGLSLLPLVAVSVIRPRARLSAFFGIVAAVSLLVALGRHSFGYALAVRALPLLNMMRYPAKAMVLVAFAWAMLAGAGFDAWRTPGAFPRRARQIAAIAIVGAAIAWAGVLLTGPWADSWARVVLDQPPRGSFGQVLAPTREALAAAGVLAAAVSAAALWRARRQQASPKVAVALGVLVVADLGWAHRDLQATAERALFERRPAVVGAIAGADGTRAFVFDYYDIVGKSYRRPQGKDLFVLPTDPLARAEALRSYAPISIAKRWGIAGSYDNDALGLYPPHLSQMAFVLRFLEDTPSFLRFLRMGSVEHVVALHVEGLEDLTSVAAFPGPFPRPIQLFRVPDPLPRCYAVGKARVAAGRAAFQLLTDPAFDPEREVVLAEGGGGESERFSGHCHVLETKPDRVRAVADLTAPGYVVLTDTYDAGWKARLDGRDVSVARANVAFLALPVPAGNHVLELVYRPRGAIAGLLASGVACLTGLASLALRLARSRHSVLAPR